MKLSKKHLYWLLQIVGWGLLFGLNAFGKLFFGASELSAFYILVETTISIGCGIAFSHLFRYLYKNKIQWNGWSWKKFILTVISILFCALLFAIAIEVLVETSYTIIEKKSLNRTVSNQVLTYLNSLAYLLFWLTLYLAINYFLRNQQMKLERLQLENTAKESQLNTLKGQINPHFMFNSLNNIRGLMLEDVDKARDMLTQLSEMLRFSLARKNDDFVPVHEELAIVRNYIALSKIQLEERLNYVEHVSETIFNYQVPPMLIQMLIENAIKHGVSNLKNGGEVALEVFKKDHFLHIVISNDGRLDAVTSGTKIGVENVVKRLRLLYDNKASFVLSQIENKVVANVQIPIA